LRKEVTGKLKNIKNKYFTPQYSINLMLVGTTFGKLKTFQKFMYKNPTLYKFATPQYFYFQNVKTAIPLTINPAPSKVFKPKGSFKIRKDNSNVMTILPLSIRATSETLPILMAL
jgi:hypothetical protein